MLHGKPLTREMVLLACDVAYDLSGNRNLMSTYAGQNLRRPAFRCALGLDHRVF